MDFGGGRESWELRNMRQEELRLISTHAKSWVSFERFSRKKVSLPKQSFLFRGGNTGCRVLFLVNRVRSKSLLDVPWTPVFEGNWHRFSEKRLHFEVARKQLKTFLAKQMQKLQRSLVYRFSGNDSARSRVPPNFAGEKRIIALHAIKPNEASENVYGAHAAAEHKALVDFPKLSAFTWNSSTVKPLMARTRPQARARASLWRTEKVWANS